jgi:hypothetical protein
MDLSRFPSKEEQQTYVTAYLEYQQSEAAGSPKRPDVEEVLEEVHRWRLVCDLYWGLWGMLQGINPSSPGFPYYDYALQRLELFLTLMSTHSH